jgi:hypothetical protein
VTRCVERVDSGATRGELDFLDAPVGGLRVELIVKFDCRTRRVDPDQEIASNSANHQITLVQICEFERIYLRARTRQRPSDPDQFQRRNPVEEKAYLLKSSTSYQA